MRLAMRSIASQAMVMFCVALSLFAFSPIERGANNDNHTYPSGFFCQHKNARAQRCTDTDPVTSANRIFSFFIHCWALFHGNAFC